MNRFWKLLNWEIARFSKFYLVMWLLTLVSQVVGLVWYVNSYISRANETMQADSISAMAYVGRYGAASFSASYNTFWFEAPVSICVAILLLYVFLIWYREWFGRNTFAYRLLMLPTSRMNVYAAKLSAILLFVLGLIAFQLLILTLENAAFNMWVPKEFIFHESLGELIMRHPLLKVFIPQRFMEFILYYAAGLMGVIVVFTAILLERSFRLKGIIAGVAYALAAGLIMILPVFLAENWSRNYFYPSEIMKMEIVVGLLVTGGSLWFSSYLLRKKVTV